MKSSNVWCRAWNDCGRGGLYRIISESDCLTLVQRGSRYLTCSLRDLTLPYVALPSVALPYGVFRIPWADVGAKLDTFLEYPTYEYLTFQAHSRACFSICPSTLCCALVLCRVLYLHRILRKCKSRLTNNLLLTNSKLVGRVLDPANS